MVEAVGCEPSAAVRLAEEAFVAALAHQQRVVVTHRGRVEANRDGLLTLSGLRGVALGELVSVAGQPALTLALGRETVTAALLSAAVESSQITTGDIAVPLGREPTIGAGPGLEGRIVNPLGVPLDGGAPPPRDAEMPLERAAPAIFERGSVRDPLYAGVLAIDALFPIGRGQRELIVGDEGTGRTSLAVDVLLNQKSSGVVCVYAGIGQRRSETWRIAEQLKDNGGRYVVVAAAEDDSPALRYLAPYAATAVGEWYRDRGEHAVVVYDDLSAHALAWRELCLLLRRPPGREAFPGDVFYLHSRLLERSAQLAQAAGGGSLTALPIGTLESGRLTAFIPTNLISITDGQLVLSSRLFSAGERPAIDAGLSVSRVGKKAQSALLAQLSSDLKLEYSAFLELERFSRLGTRLEEGAEQRLAIGRRLRALFHGKNGSPLSLSETAVRLSLARRRDQLARLAEDRVLPLASEVARRLVDQYPELERDVRDAAVSPEGLERLVAAAIQAGTA